MNRERFQKRKVESGKRTIFSSAQRLAPSAQRKGILLLVVLTMLTLFLLIGTAYLVSASHFRKMNKVMARSVENQSLELVEASLLDQVINQLVRDTKNPSSSLRFHSLLRDMYGSEGLSGTISNTVWAWDGTGNTNPTNGQVVQFEIPETAITNLLGINEELSPVDNAYNGLVLTFSDGIAEGISTRVIGYRRLGTATPYTGLFRVIAFRTADGKALSDVPNWNTELNGSRIVINGRPFNGTGFGFNPTITSANTARLATLERVLGVNREIALMPNASFFDYQQLYLDGTSGNSDGTFDQYGPFFSSQWNLLTAEQKQILVDGIGINGLGGSDESYDAPDFQNMALGMLPLNPVESVAFGSTDLGNMVLPSFHRPALLNYWQNNTSNPVDLADPANANMLRKVLMRPNWFDHPNFTGSNPEYANYLAAMDYASLQQQMIYGPWDVDNDNDGVRDSMWIDFGAPAIPGPNGKLVKPLAAVLVLDMDGRLNLNAHGSAELAVPANFTLPVAGGTTTADLPQGEGYGPADISLAPVLGDRLNFLLNGAVRNDYVFPGSASGDPVYERGFQGKFGDLTFPGADEGNNFNGIFDILAQLKMQGMPSSNERTLGLNSQSNYVTPPDLKCRYAMPGLNDLGQPVHEAHFDNYDPGNTTDRNIYDRAALDQDSPYEINLSADISRGDDPSSDDSAFSLAEIERILRAYDVNTGTLPDRLWQLAGGFLPNMTATTPDPAIVNRWRTLLTTDSYDLPVPNVVVPEWMILGQNKTNDLPTNSDNDDFEDVMGTTNIDGDHVPRTTSNVSFVDLLEYQVRIAIANSVGGGLLPKDVPEQQTVLLRSIMSILMPQDLADGLRLDVNRAFGNGRDDDEPGDPGYGIVDEPGEDEMAFWEIDTARGGIPSVNGTPLQAFVDPREGVPGGLTGRFANSYLIFKDYDLNGVIDVNDYRVSDLDGDGTIGNSGNSVLAIQERIAVHNLRRQDMARDMFILAMTLVDPIITDPGNITANQKAQIRQIAQWAINTVDYRDPDNIMTAFEYDENPFDGWNVDGDISDISTDNSLPERGVVWGTERPELLITETLAWHDRRTEDTRQEGELSNLEPGDGTMPADVGSGGVSDPSRDTSFDQRERPQGAGFIELYNPWPQSPAANADIHDLHTSPGNDMGVDLARTHNDTTNSQDTTSGDPVWRMMVYKFGGFGRNPEDPDTTNRPTNHSGANIAHRSIYFVGRDPGFEGDGVAYYNDLETTLDGEQNPVPPVRPGRYLVIGAGDKQPGTNNYLAKFGEQEGTRSGSERGIMLMPDATSGSDDRCIALQRANTVYITDSLGFEISAPSEAEASAVANPVIAPLTGDNTDGFTASVAIIDQCFDTNLGATKDCRFTFSEPAGGYPNRVQIESLTRNGWTTSSAWDDTQKRYVPTIDVPLDDQRLATGGGGGLAGAPGRTSLLQDNETRLTLPESDSNTHERTIPGFSWVYMQRLANPTQEWNPEPGDSAHIPTIPVNPYLTIDSMGVNVTVFNGLSRDERRLDTNNRTGTPNRYRNVNSRSTFASLQRGRSNDYRNADASGNTTLEARLQQLTNDQERVQRGRSLNEIDPVPTPAVAASLWTSENTAVLAGNRAGMNADGLDNGDTSHNFTGIPDSTLGFLNEPFRGNTTSTAGTQETRDRLLPSQPFPLLSWNNRPYVSANELMQVPAYSSSQALQTFSTRAGNESYDGSTTELSNQSNLQVDGPYGHLMNFFRSQAGTTAGQEGIVGMYRLLDYIQTPSPYVATETWLNPAAFGVDLPTGTTSDDPRLGRQPPFNRISSYRDPGRVNLNTIVNENVWNGLFHGTPSTPSAHSGPSWDAIRASRRGYDAIDPISGATVAAGRFEIFHLDNHSPTFFANPFRSSDAGNNIPLLQLRRPRSVETERMRSDRLPKLTIAGGDINPDCLGTNPTELLPTDNPLFSANTATTSDAYRNTNRNTYFRYQPMTRLDNLTTTRSNVYAVWVTIGFFEVAEAEPEATFAAKNGLAPGSAESIALYNKVYPEGYAFGKEYGIETGDIRRVRQFAIIDRSIPVAFEPGVDHNIERAIRLKRRIE